MKEQDIIKLIKQITYSEYIGDDCACLNDFGMVITQDNLVENVHFSLNNTTPYKLGWKSSMVNISDICASGAKPMYMTVALSIPKYIDENFIKEFYLGIKESAKDIKIVGGDITGSDKIFISITAIGSTKNRKIASRKNAKPEYLVVVSGEHGNSATGLKILANNLEMKNKEKFINAHLMPTAQRKFSENIAQNIKTDYAMMDTSDGLADALVKIAQSSCVDLCIDSSKIPHDINVDFDTVLYGGEDYQLVAAVPAEVLKYLNKYYIIGNVKPGTGFVKIDGHIIDNVSEKIFNHFKL